MQELDAHFKGIQETIIAEISKAKSSIFVVMAWFMDDLIIQELTKKAIKGVSVEVIISNHEFNDSDKFNNLISAGGDVFKIGGVAILDQNFMHNKFCVIDNNTVITGSYNWTRNAKTNKENIVVIKNKLTASKYTDESISLLKMATPLDSESTTDIRIVFTASKRKINSNESSEIFWKVENAEHVSISTIGENLDFQGNHLISISQTKTFRLTAENSFVRKVKTLEIEIIEAPNILKFRSSRKAIIRGQKVILSWETKNAEIVTLKPDFGELPLTGELSIIPNHDTLYILEAKGINSTEKSSLQIHVYDHPKIEVINVPTPTEINLHAFVDISATTIPSGLNFVELKKDIVQRTPKINFIMGDMNIGQPLKEFSRSLNKQIHDLELPLKNHERLNFSFKSKVLNRMEIIFKNNVKALQILSQIRKTYEI